MKFEQKLNNTLKVLIFLFIILQFIFIFVYNIHYDEREHLHAAYLIHNSQIPYVDFFEHHMPFLWFSISGFMLLPAIISIFASRILIFLFSLGIVFLVYKISSKYYSKTAALFACFLLLSFRQFFISSFLVRPDTISAFFLLLSLFFILKTDVKSKKVEFNYFLIGLFMCTSVLFQIKAVFLILPLLLVLLFKKKLTLKNFGLFVIGGIIPLILLCAALGFSIAKLKVFCFLTTYFNLHISGGNPILYNLLTYIEVNSFFIIALLFAIFDFKYLKKNKTFAFLVIFSLLFLVFFAKTGLIGPQYFLYVLPFFVIFSAPKLTSLFFNQKTRKLFMILFVVLGMLLPLAAVTFEFYRADLKTDLKELRFFLNNNDVSKPSLDDGWLIFHKNADYLWFSQQDYAGLLISNGIITEFNLTKLILEKPEFIKTAFLRLDDNEKQFIEQNYILTDFNDLYMLKK